MSDKTILWLSITLSLSAAGIFNAFWADSLRHFVQLELTSTPLILLFHIAVWHAVRAAQGGR